jgi:glycine cleavage system aminomethyltransferase T
MTPQAPAFRPIRVSAMQAAHVALGATFDEVTTETGVWRVPAAYGGPPEEEARRARAAVGVADVSAWVKIEARGDALPALLERLGGLESVAPGAARPGTLDGATVLACRLAADQVLFLARPADAVPVGRRLAAGAEGLGCLHLTDLTSAFAAVDLLGPRVAQLLARLVPLDLAAVGPGSVVQGPLARVPAVLIRLDRPGLPPALRIVRALVGREYGAFVWHAVTEAGHDLGLAPVGTAARALLDGGA